MRISAFRRCADSLDLWPTVKVAAAATPPVQESADVERSRPPVALPMGEALRSRQATVLVLDDLLPVVAERPCLSVPAVPLPTPGPAVAGAAERTRKTTRSCAVEAARLWAVPPGHWPARAEGQVAPERRPKHRSATIRATPPLVPDCAWLPREARGCREKCEAHCRRCRNASQAQRFGRSSWALAAQ